MSFAHPWVLFFLLLIPLLAWLQGRAGQQPAFLYSSIQLVKGITSLSRSRSGAILAKFRWLALALLILALARPQTEQGHTQITASGVDIVVAIDLSGSMRSEDFELSGERANRLEVAKDVLRKFIQKRANDRIGLVAFAGRAYTAAPLTLDHEFLQQNLDRLQIGMIEDSTAIGSALSASINRLRDVPSKSKIVILMTDGQNNAGSIQPLTAAEAAEAIGVKVYTIGVGRRGYAPMPMTGMFGQTVYQQVKVDIDEDTLTKIAEKTRGKYFRADSTSTLRSIYEEIDRFEKSEVKAKKYSLYEEKFAWFAVPGLFLLLLEIILSHTIWRRLP